MSEASVALLLLASGLSSRFANGDKLMAPLGDSTVLDQTAQLDLPAATARIAVTNPQAPARGACLTRHGWHCLDNDSPESGQSHALWLGIRHICEHTDAAAVCILLADMPFIAPAHLAHLTRAFTQDIRAVMSSDGTASMPPALFRRADFKALSASSGDKGARSIFQALDNTATVDLPAWALMDIDTVSDLQIAEASLNG